MSSNMPALNSWSNANDVYLQWNISQVLNQNEYYELNVTLSSLDSGTNANQINATIRYANGSEENLSVGTAINVAAGGGGLALDVYIDGVTNPVEQGDMVSFNVTLSNTGETLLRDVVFTGEIEETRAIFENVSATFNYSTNSYCDLESLNTTAFVVNVTGCVGVPVDVDEVVVLFVNLTYDNSSFPYQLGLNATVEYTDENEDEDFSSDESDITINEPVYDYVVEMLVPEEGNVSAEGSVQFRYNLSVDVGGNFTVNCTLLLLDADNESDSNNPIVLDDDIWFMRVCL